MGFSVRVADPRNKFSASHFLFEHNKCSRLHGHNYHVNVDVSGPLTGDYFVVDFYELKHKLKHILSNLDHVVLLPGKSPNIQIIKENEQVKVRFNQKYYEFPAADVRILDLPATTAELLAKYIHDQLKEHFPHFGIVVEVGESVGSIGRYQA